MDLIERIETAVSAPFDYSSLDPAVASQARASAARIKEQFQKYRASIIEAGRELLAIKDQLGHGNFGPWLEAEFQMAERTAQRYMSVAAAFSDKSDIVSVLPQTALIELAAPSTPEHVRAEVVKRVEAGEPIKPTEIKTMVREAREADRKTKEEEKRAARLAKMSPEERKALEQKEKRQRRTAEQRAEADRQWKLNREAEETATIDAATEALALLKKHLPADELAKLAQLLEAGQRAFDSLLADAAGIALPPYRQWWVNKAKDRTPQDAAA